MEYFNFLSEGREIVNELGDILLINPSCDKLQKGSDEKGENIQFVLAHIRSGKRINKNKNKKTKRYALGKTSLV